MKKKKASEEQTLNIYRLANQRDIDEWAEYRAKEEAIKKEARKLAQFHKLAMKITDVEYQGDGGKVTFYYIADGRVDFRQLIKDYAITFKTKIDMKQIGFRQEAAKVGGIGPCGRELCCSTWLTDFRSVNTNVARYQQLSINPQKLAGQCGKLKCCLNFELDSYLDALSFFPPTNSTLDTEKGKAFCIKIDVFKKKMWFAYVENSMTWYDLDINKVKKELSNNKKGLKSPSLEELSGLEASTAGFKPSADLIQENSVDRFMKKKKTNNKKQEKETSTPQPNTKESKQQTNNEGKKTNKNYHPSNQKRKRVNNKKPNNNGNKPNNQ